MERVRERNLPPVLVFIDFRKAFDSVHRGKMLKILKILSAHGIPDKLVKAVLKTYEGTKARVLTPDGEMEKFEIQAGVLQGDNLAPYIFAIMLDYCMKQAIGDEQEILGSPVEGRRSRRTPTVVISDLDFADDIALISDEIAQAHELVLRVEKEAAEIGLHLNETKDGIHGIQSLSRGRRT